MNIDRNSSKILIIYVKLYIIYCSGGKKRERNDMFGGWI